MIGQTDSATSAESVCLIDQSEELGAVTCSTW
jgi:hypothetical protein